MYENYNEYYEYPNDELKHYGVVGMRWGIRRAQRKGKEYNYRSHGQKKYERKVKKLEKRRAPHGEISVAKDKLETYKARDKNRQDYAKSTTVGRSVAKGLLLGPFGAGGYNRLRAAGYGRVTSALASNVVTSSFSLPIQLFITKGAEYNSANMRRRGNDIR